MTLAVMVKPRADKPAKLIPDGTYKAHLVEVKEFTNAFGDRLGFVFEIDEGEQKGTVLMKSTANVLAPKGQLLQVVTGLLGREVTDDEVREGFNLHRLAGTNATILAIQSKGKGGITYSNIERVFRG
jgi:hypothetical protein